MRLLRLVGFAFDVAFGVDGGVGVSAGLVLTLVLVPELWMLMMPLASLPQLSPEHSLALT